jgi:ATP-dependent Zn protease
MKKLILSVFVMLLISSCSTTKKLLKTDTSVKKTVTERKQITRPGDTITINIPNIRYKDTVITRVNYENKTIARVRYDNKGNQQFECLSAEIDEKLELIREEVNNNIKEQNDIKRSFNPQHFIYALAFLVVVILIGFGLIGFMFMRLQKQLPGMIANITKEVIK